MHISQRDIALVDAPTARQAAEREHWQTQTSPLRRLSRVWQMTLSKRTTEIQDSFASGEFLRSASKTGEAGVASIVTV